MNLHYRPRVLDLGCNAGGASEGYRRAGYIPFGVDIAPQKNYPYTFRRCDMLEYAALYAQDFDLIHASPPCQGYSPAMSIRKDAEEQRAKYPDLITPLREILKASGRPYVIENTPGAPLNTTVVLKGTMFGLRVIRDRLFEIYPALPQLYFTPVPVKIGSVVTGEYMTVAGSGGAMWADKAKTKRRAGSRHVEDWRAAMRISWTTKEEIVEMIPPAYTHWIGMKLLPYILGQFGQATA